MLGVARNPILGSTIIVGPARRKTSARGLLLLLYTKLHPREGNAAIIGAARYALVSRIEGSLRLPDAEEEFEYAMRAQ